MRIRTIAPIAAACAALLTATAPRAALAQTAASADFTAAHRLVVDQQFMRAAQAVGAASVYVRQELGRSRDEGVGLRLMSAESRLDGLVARLRASRAPAIASLDSVFADTDLLLAEHHWQMARWELVDRRNATRLSVGEDLGAAARFFARSFPFVGREPEPEVARAIADARRVAGEIVATDALPKETSQVIDALGKHLVAPVAIAVR
jgi:hypothetical protein